MKKIALLLSIFLVAPFLVPAEAEARGYGSQRISSCNSCGGHTYRIRQFCGYDRCGRPIYRYITRNDCRCGSHYGRHHRSRSYCPPPRHHRSHHSRGGISFFWKH